MTYSIIKDSDSYKWSHFLLYPEDVEYVYSYAESRGGFYPSTMFFGLQPFLINLIRNAITEDEVDEADDFAKHHGVPFNRSGWNYIVDKYDGHLPIRIKAVPEGTVVPTGNVLCTVENTDPNVPWLTSFVETALLRQVWYGSTVASRIFRMKKSIRQHFLKTAETLDALPFALLDFSSRGCTSYGANEIGGAAYLAHFQGSDSIPAVDFVNDYYGSGMSGFSVPASEHSVTTSWGRGNSLARKKAYIERVPAGSIISDVLDTWDVFAEAEEWVTLKDALRAKNLTLVARPDSGKPENVLPRLLRIFRSGFGATPNSLGYDVLNGVKVLWGDGIDEYSHMTPFEIAADFGVSADSIMIGSGGGLMQVDLNRDTHKFAFKASAIKRNGSREWEGISKDPITDPGKRSKEGRLFLTRTPSRIWETHSTLIDAVTPEDRLRTVYLNGELQNAERIDAIRARIDVQL